MGMKSYINTWQSLLCTDQRGKNGLWASLSHLARRRVISQGWSLNLRYSRHLLHHSSRCKKNLPQSKGKKITCLNAKQKENPSAKFGVSRKGNPGICSRRVKGVDPASLDASLSRRSQQPVSGSTDGGWRATVLACSFQPRREARFRAGRVAGCAFSPLGPASPPGKAGPAAGEARRGGHAAPRASCSESLPSRRRRGDEEKPRFPRSLQAREVAGRGRGGERTGSPREGTGVVRPGAGKGRLQGRRKSRFEGSLKGGL